MPEFVWYAGGVGFLFAVLLAGMGYHIWRRKREEVALERARAFAAGGKAEQALHSYRLAEACWACRAGRESCASKREELDRLTEIARGIADQSAALGLPVSCEELLAAIAALQDFYAARDNFEWDGMLKQDPELARSLERLNARLREARDGSRTAASS